MKIFNNFGLCHLVSKISINEFKRNLEIKHPPHSETLLDNFIADYKIDFAIRNFKTFNNGSHIYEDHQRVFYSEKNNAVFVTVQPYRKNPKLAEYGFIELDKKLSWHYPNEAFLYILCINQIDACMFFVNKTDVIRISHKTDVDIIYRHKDFIIAQKGSISEVNDLQYSFVYAKKRG